MDCIGRVDDCIFVRPLPAPSRLSGVGDLSFLVGLLVSSRDNGEGVLRRRVTSWCLLGEFSVRRVGRSLDTAVTLPLLGGRSGDDARF